MNKKYLDALVIILITVSVTAVVFMFLESNSPKNDKEKPDNNVSSDVSKEENTTDVNETNETNETETSNVVYNDNKVTYDRCVNSFKKVFTYENYLVCSNTDYDKYNNIENDYSWLWTRYYVVDTKTKILYAAFEFSTLRDEADSNAEPINYYFIAYEDDGQTEIPTNRGMFSLSNEKVLAGYSDYSCEFHSDESVYLCSNVNATMVKEHASDKAYYGLVSLKDFSFILNVEYESMYELGDNFMVSKKNKYGLYSNTGKKLLDVKYDYLGYNDYIGYVGIIGNDIELYNTKLEKQDLSKKSLKDVFEESYAKFEQERDSDDGGYLFMQMADSYFWTIGSAMTIHDMSKPFDFTSDNDYRYKYTGTKYTGEQLVINSHCGYNYIYVIQNNKAYKIDSKEIYQPNESYGTCF